MDLLVPQAVISNSVAAKKAKEKKFFFIKLLFLKGLTSDQSFLEG